MTLTLGPYLALPCLPCLLCLLCLALPSLLCLAPVCHAHVMHYVVYPNVLLFHYSVCSPPVLPDEYLLVHHLGIL